jgi:hypothetical protein
MIESQAEWSYTRRALAIFPPVGAALIIVGEAIMPKALDNTASTVGQAAHQVVVAGANEGRSYAATLLVIFGLAAVGVSFTGIATLISHKSGRLATVITVMGWFVTICGVIANTAVNYVLPVMAEVHPNIYMAAQIEFQLGTAHVTDILLVVYFFGLILTFVLAGVALWRSRVTPRWLAAAFPVSWLLLTFATHGVFGIPQSLPYLAFTIVLASLIWRSANLEGFLTGTKQRRLTGIL